MTQVRKRRPRTPKQAAACCDPLDGLLNVELFRALGDPNRASFLACLAKCGRPCSVGEVAECCSVDLSVVSRHLSLLARAGVLSVSKEGRTVFYTVRYADLSGTLLALAESLQRCGVGATGSCCGNA